jgi:shikimate kinase
VHKPEIVYLVGFMGAGKTCVGKSLAQVLGYTFVDLDAEIEKSTGALIRDIFARQGEPHFRAIEHEELKRASTIPHRVIALGGGAFISAANREIVRQSGTSVWLDVPLDVLMQRIEGDHSRPLASSRPELQALFETRCPIYAQSDIRIDAGTLPPAQLAAQISQRLEKVSDLDF